MDDKTLQLIQRAEFVLVGLGEEFEDRKLLKQNAEYAAARQRLEEQGLAWAAPVLDRYTLKENSGRIIQALSRLRECLKDKNYFVITTAVNDFVWESGFAEERVTAPCGGSRKIQCVKGCSGALKTVTQEDVEYIYDNIRKGSPAKLITETCPECGAGMVLNNVYADKYDENGYLDQWKLYTKWLQGTLNRKVCILELGAGMECPTVIRWPFEKIAYFNKSADFIRVHENLYYLAEEIRERGISIPQNAVDWLLDDGEKCRGNVAVRPAAG